ncbi:hypothetical protein F5J12DRAFT_551200 [Pisolithus orientalis]|uniref:uncharacterized protein n=1 Tax=Pisolithus orientalis TaxID=936130 RepID=UPI002224B295|nr:uncharacterized protein F5J12DRAFT_551200 [Pisolithus orientalis]KAI6012776.1 hypothetical protein F5J12DRAFT_551200 [Pisolithus orientalis]
MADEVITSLSNMFGLKDLTNYVGEITFFKKLPLMVGTKPAGEGAAGVAEVPGDGLQSCAPKSSPGALVAIGNPSKLRQQSITIQDPRLEVALPLLLKECQTLGMWYRTSSRNSTTKQKIKHEARCISQTLGAGILQHISMAFTCGHLCIDYDGQLSTGSILQEINALQTKLDATENEAEQRVLEEDITGKILWFCWHGICLEVHELLSEVLNYIRKAGEVYGLLKIGQIIEQVMPDLNGDQAHLQRIMADARAGTSKHQLWLAATAPQHTNLRDKTISRDKPTRNTEETNLGTSSQMSPTSADL